MPLTEKPFYKTHEWFKCGCETFYGEWQLSQKESELKAAGIDPEKLPESFTVRDVLAISIEEAKRLIGQGNA